MTISKLICWWKGHDVEDLFLGTEMEGLNRYCKRCYRPDIGTWAERYLAIWEYQTDRRMKDRFANEGNPPRFMNEEKIDQAVCRECDLIGRQPPCEHIWCKVRGHNLSDWQWSVDPKTEQHGTMKQIEYRGCYYCDFSEQRDMQ